MSPRRSIYRSRSLLSKLVDGRRSRQSFIFEGYPVTVWKGNRPTEATYREIYERRLFNDWGLFQYMLKDYDSAQICCAVRDPETHEIMSYTLLIDDGLHCRGLGTRDNGILGLLGTFTDEKQRGKGAARKALRLMADEVLKFGEQGETGRPIIYLQSHVAASFGRIIEQYSDKQLDCRPFNYLEDLRLKVQDLNEQILGGNREPTVIDQSIARELNFWKKFKAA